MTTQEVANRLVEMCRNGQIMEAQDELYADNVVSIEPEKAPMGHRVEGLEAVKEKGRQFGEMIEEHHGGSISDPIVGGEYFSIAWKMEATMKGIGRQTLDEICVYHVQDGKVVREEFFY